MVRIGSMRGQRRGGGVPEGRGRGDKNNNTETMYMHA